jgi:hypothetical protein
MNKKILFDHIPKCAGSSIHALLQNAFGADRVAPHLQGISVSNAMRLFSDYDVVSGHFLGRILINAPFPLYRFTVVRHPVDRILSHYHYLRQIAGPGTATGDLFLNMSLDEFIRTSDQRFMAAVENLLCIHFADALGPVTRSSALLPMAKQAVECYDLVGIYEDLDATVRRICQLCEIPPVQLPKINVTRDRRYADEIEPCTLKIIEEKNRFDAELYKHIADRFYQASESGKESRGKTRSVSSAAKQNGELFNFGTYEVSIERVSLRGATSGTVVLASGEVLEIACSLTSRVADSNLVLCVIITDIFGDYAYGTDTTLLGQRWDIGPNETTDVEIKVTVNLGIGTYRVSLVAYCGERFTKKDYYHWAENAAAFEVRGNIGERFFGYSKLTASIRRV